MTLRTLQVEFGGLCMLVQRTSIDPKGLFVLMPAMDHEGMAHCPLFVCNEKYCSGAATPPVEQLDGAILRLGNLGNTGSKKKTPDFADISKYAGDVRVDESCMTGAALPPCVACRIELPLPNTAFESKGSRASFRVPVHVNNELKYEPKSLVGRACVGFEVTDPTAWDLKIGTTQLAPDSNGLLEIAFLNVRVKDLDMKTFKHHKFEPWKHQQSYYWLLNGFCEDRQEGPPAIFDADVDGIPDNHDHDEPCRNAKTKIKAWPPGKVFVDPFNCTIGTGCAQNETNC